MDNRIFKSPFPRRPWMQENGYAAAAAGPGSTGIKGIIAGRLCKLFLILI